MDFITVSYNRTLFNNHSSVYGTRFIRLTLLSSLSFGLSKRLTIDIDIEIDCGKAIVENGNIAYDFILRFRRMICGKGILD